MTFGRAAMIAACASLSAGLQVDNESRGRVGRVPVQDGSGASVHAHQAWETEGDPEKISWTSVYDRTFFLAERQDLGVDTAASEKITWTPVNYRTSGLADRQGLGVDTASTASSNNRVVTLVTMVGLSVLARLADVVESSRAALVADCVVWYLATTIYLVESTKVQGPNPTIALSLLSTVVQLGSGAAMLPLGGRQLLTIPIWPRVVHWRLAVGGVAFFIGSALSVVALCNIPFVEVANVRCLEPFTTTGLYFATGGALDLSAWQVIGLALAVGGVLMSNVDPSHTQVTLAASWALIIMLSNCGFSTRNVVMSNVGSQVPKGSKLLVFTLTCFWAALCGGLMLGCFCFVDGKGLQFANYDLWALCMSSLAFVLYNLASFQVLIKLNPVAHSMLISGKRVFTVLYAWVILRFVPSNWCLVGMLVTASGCYLFEMKESASQNSSQTKPPPDDATPSRSNPPQGRPDEAATSASAASSNAK